MKEALDLLRKLEQYRKKLDLDLIHERLPVEFSSYAAALTIANGLDGAIEAMKIACDLAIAMDDAADEANTQKDALQ